MGRWECGLQKFFPGSNGLTHAVCLKNSVAAGMGGQYVSRQSTEDFQGSENIAHDTTMTDLSNPQNAHHREGALYVNYGL